MTLEDSIPSTKVKDIYRDTPLRYLGYANEVGEAFRSIIGTRWVNVTYGVATTYVLADTTDKSSKVYKITQNDKNCITKTVHTAIDTVLWQMLASVIIPGITINRTCAFAGYILKKQKKFPKDKRKWIVTVIGLATIPFIIRPIDHLVDMLMDKTYRKFIT